MKEVIAVAVPYFMASGACAYTLSVTLSMLVFGAGGTKEQVQLIKQPAIVCRVALQTSTHYDRRHCRFGQGDHTSMVSETNIWQERADPHRDPVSPQLT